MFKKLLSLFIGFIFLAGTTNAQVTNYKFTSITGGASAYTQITGTPLVLQYNGAADSDDGYATLPLGFTFNFNGVNYTTGTACANGWLSFAAVPNNASTWVNNLTSGLATSRPLLAPLWDDMFNSGDVEYLTTGIAPLRVCTIQWTNEKWDYSATAPVMSFQIKLYETTNIIEYIYRSEAGTVATGSGGASIGITAAATGSGNFLSVSGAGQTASVSSTVETTNITAKPATGSIYMFEPRYCSARGLILAGSEKISNVTFNTINSSNTSNAEYLNRTTISTAVQPGNTYPISVGDNGNGYFGDSLTVWIDFNNNGVFTDPGEKVFAKKAGPSGGPYTGTITIPAGTPLGYTRMRLRLDDQGSSGANSTPCGDAAWGNVIDYSILVQLCSAAAESIPPANATACNGGNASFTETASGTGITYQWQVSTDGGTTYTNLTNTAPYSGVNTATLNITGATASMSGYKYRVSFGGTCTLANTFSSAATLTVNTPVTITTQPVNASSCTGNNASFSVAATGTSPGYQWQVSTDGGTTWTNITNNANYAGATTTNLSITNAPFSWNGYQYRAVVTVGSCGSVNSAAATLTVFALPTLTISSPLTSLYPGLSTTITANASPAAASNVFTWYRNGSVINGSTGSTINVTVDGMGAYTASVKDANGCVSAISNTVVIGDSATTKLFIYPNPTTGKFQVRYYSVNGNVLGRTVSIYDAKGARVMTQTFSVGRPYDRMDIDMSNIGRGIYWVELGDLNGKRITVGRVIRL